MQCERARGDVNLLACPSSNRDLFRADNVAS